MNYCRYYHVSLESGLRSDKDGYFCHMAADVVYRQCADKAGELGCGGLDANVHCLQIFANFTDICIRLCGYKVSGDAPYKVPDGPNTHCLDDDVKDDSLHPYCLYRSWNFRCTFLAYIPQLGFDSAKGRLVKTYNPSGFSTARFVPGTYFGYQCQAGYALANESNPVQLFHCAGNMVVNYDQGAKCFPLKCKEDPDFGANDTGIITNDWDGEARLDGSKFTYTCGEGYAFNGTWNSSIVGVCEVGNLTTGKLRWRYDAENPVMNCIGYCFDKDLPASPHNSTFNSTRPHNTDGQVATWTCIAGHEFRGLQNYTSGEMTELFSPSINVTCIAPYSEPGNWSFDYAIPTGCERVKCLGPLPDINSTGRVDVEREWDGNSREYETSIRHFCSTPYQKFQGDSGVFYDDWYVGCQADKTWNVTTIPDPCRWTHCIDPPIPASAHKLNLTSFNPLSPPEIGKSVTFVCNAGGYNWFKENETKNTYQLECLENNTFSTPVWPTCIDTVTCPVPTGLNKSDDIHTLWSQGDSHSYTDLVSWECKDPRYLIKQKGAIASPQRTIKSNCSWYETYDVYPDKLECILTFCYNPDRTFLEAPYNFSIINNLIDSNFTYLSKSMTYVCDGGHNVLNSTKNKSDADSTVTIYCGSDGLYKYPDDFPQCASTVFCASPELNDDINITDIEDQDFEYSTKITYICKDPRGYLRLIGESGSFKQSIDSHCGWNKIFDVSGTNLQCKISVCAHPHNDPGRHDPPPHENYLNVVEQNWKVPFDDNIAYECIGNRYFESDEEHPSKTSIQVQCIRDQGVYNIPQKWPNCTHTVLCGQPPSIPPAAPPWYENGSIKWLHGAVQKQETYNTTVEYSCADGSMFDLDNDGKGDVTKIRTTCLWNKNWSPYSELPPCVVTHCVRPFDIPSDSYLEELTSQWTPIREFKEYQCQGVINGKPTRYWESNRQNSGFKIYCSSEGIYDFVNTRANWPTCLEDIECEELPPPIPSHEEYTLEEYDGTVTLKAIIYPNEIEFEEFHNSSYNNTYIPRNFNANLTYYCGDARHFTYGNDMEPKITQTMICQWDKTWKPTNHLGECEWFACLKPTTAPKSTNLIPINWDGKPISFEEKITYACDRGTFNTDDQYVNTFEYICQDGSKKKTRKGFFNTPEAEKDWPQCLKGTSFFQYEPWAF